MPPRYYLQFLLLIRFRLWKAATHKTESHVIQSIPCGIGLQLTFTFTLLQHKRLNSSYCMHVLNKGATFTTVQTVNCYFLEQGLIAFIEVNWSCISQTIPMYRKSGTNRSQSNPCTDCEHVARVTITCRVQGSGLGKAA